jgi:hypothetical protein
VELKSPGPRSRSRSLVGIGGMVVSAARHGISSSAVRQHGSTADRFSTIVRYRCIPLTSPLPVHLRILTKSLEPSSYMRVAFVWNGRLSIIRRIWWGRITISDYKWLAFIYWVFRLKLENSHTVNVLFEWGTQDRVNTARNWWEINVSLYFT